MLSTVLVMVMVRAEAVGGDKMSEGSGGCTTGYVLCSNGGAHMMLLGLTCRVLNNVVLLLLLAVT